MSKVDLEKIGIDKIVLDNIVINNDDIYALITALRQMSGISYHHFNNFRPDIDRCFYLKILNNNYFNLGKITYHPQTHSTRFELSFSAANFYNGSNVRNMSLCDVQNYCKNLESYLDSEYNIHADFGGCEIKSLEINTNIALDHPYRDYIPTLDNLMHKVATYKKTYTNHTPLMNTKLEKDEDETTKAIGNTQMEIVHYDKYKEAKAKGKLPQDEELGADLMRIELKLLDKRKIQYLFGTNKLYSSLLTDQLVAHIFKLQYQKNIVKQQRKADKERLKKLETIIRHYTRSKDRNWHYQLLEEIRNENERRICTKNGYPLVQDIDEIFLILRKCLKTNLTNTIAAFIRKQTPDDVLYHPLIRPELLQEIFVKVERSR